MPQIQLTDLHNVLIDGINCDDIFAAIRNHPELREELELTALHWSIYSSNSVKERERLTGLVTQKDADIAAVLATHERIVAEKDDALAANNADMETIRANTKKAITAAAQYLQALMATELSEAQQAAVAGLGGVLAFASKSEIQRRYDEAQKAAAEAQAKADALAAQIQASNSTL